MDTTHSHPLKYRGNKILIRTEQHKNVFERLPKTKTTLPTMLKNYFKLMMRNLLKRKGFAFINLFGLSTGMAVCILLVMYIQNELGYDAFHEHGDQVYRLALDRKYTTRTAHLGHIPKSIGKA